MGDVLLSVTLFSCPQAGQKQLCNAAMIKTSGTHHMDAVARALSRWAGVQRKYVELVVDRVILPADLTVAECGLKSGNPVVAYLAPESPPPSAAATSAPFAMIDVTDSELAASMDGLSSRFVGSRQLNAPRPTRASP